MRKAIIFTVLIAACSRAETPPPDTAAAMAPAPPANLTPADIAGSWQGTSKVVGTDSVVAKWVTSWTSDSTGTITYEGTKTPVAMTTMLDADSLIAKSVAFLPPNAKKGAPKVRFTSIARVQDGKLVGRSMTYLADKPDSVLWTRTFEATKAP